MATNDAPEGIVLVGTDGSERAQRAVAWAAREAEIRGSRLTILTAWTPQRAADATLWGFGYAGSKLLEDIRAKQRYDAAALVEEAARSVRERYPDLDVRVILHEGEARDGLMEYGQNASLIVIGSRGAGPIASVALGSVAFWMTRHSPVPVAVVPTGAELTEGVTRQRGVVAGVSLDPLSVRVVEAAAAEAEERRSDLLLAYCQWDGEAAKRRWDRIEEADLPGIDVDMVERLARSVRKKYPRVLVRRRFARGAADHFLADISRHHEMLVLGRRVSSPLDLFEVGTMAAAVFRDAPFVILVVPLARSGDEARAAAGETLRPARVG